MKFRWLGVALIAATALSPIIATAAEAQDGERGGGFASRIMREARTGGGGENRPQRAERQQAPQRQADQPRPQRSERGNGGGQRWEGRRGGGEGWQGRQVEVPQDTGQPQPQPRWEGRRGNGGGWQGRSVEVPQDAGQPQPQPRWEGRRGGWRGQRPGQVIQPDGAGVEAQPDGRWEGRRRGGFGSDVVRDARRNGVPVQPGTTFDRDRDGRVDPQWDRNRDGRVDEVWDDNRNGRLDREWDRNRDGRLDGRWDRNDDERVDRRWDRNGNGRVDNRYRRYGGWDRSWRHDRRYDWYGHRARYGDIYRLGRYYSPYRDWRYRRLDIGFSLWPLFYTERYWINDPWQYRLPDVWGPYRWVRYYDDALLVDLRTGQVVDVIHGVFW